MKFKLLNEFLAEKYSASMGLKKGKWTQIDPKKHPELADEFFELIDIAYAAVGGHIKVNKPDDVFKDPDWTFWEVIDHDEDPDIDIVIWGQHSKYGIKFSGVGHDGSRESKREYIKARIKNLKTRGYFIEVSDRIAEILIEGGAPTVNTKEDVEKVLGKEIVWHGQHPYKKMPGVAWYSRQIAGHMHAKILVGRPKL